MFKILIIILLSNILLAESVSNVFSLESYLERLIKEDVRYKNRNLESKVLLLTSLLEQSRYNPDLFLDARFKGEDPVNVSKLDDGMQISAVGTINFNMRIYDAQKDVYTLQRKKLFDELSSLEVLNAKEQLQLMGLKIYIDLFRIQETIKQYNLLLKYQNKITKIAIDRASKGLGGIYDKTQAVNDLINIKLKLVDLKEKLIEKEYLFRQAINLDSDTFIRLQKIRYDELDLSLKELQHKSISQNIRLKFRNKQYELSQSDIDVEKSKRGFSVDFQSNYGYGYMKQYNDILVDETNYNDTWSALISIKYPLDQRNEIVLRTQRSKIKALQAKNGVEIERRALNRTINKLYNMLQKYKIKNQLFLEQKKVLQERIKITYNRYKEALENYKPYSDSLRDMARSDEAYINNSLSIDETTLQLYILSGSSILE
jgi:outer membrane protein TolC